MSDKRFTVELTDKELNYLDSALHAAITEKEFDIFRFGKNGTNAPHLLWFTKRLRSKLRRIHYPPRGVPKSTPEIRALIRGAKSYET